VSESAVELGKLMMFGRDPERGARPGSVKDDLPVKG
jgi:hypothetical protein